ncbi:MAG: membrane protein insertase YidC [Gemmatimonadota bacterium]|nr:membrane protein insertase YidC [Gemmatimonadota bacterium]MDE2864599.1 membrane protein insertase YidC [Gemmatimonadota bacterium]MXV96397.1 membrane protein insertase YidC [Gemmatimonadota bacterium]MYB08022.1 membrane protein insertase YidC [Gemmatimonadota bacterium]MYE16482.1 membrane protein insertase YidC [Gemmatimonadota bacterium]
MRPEFRFFLALTLMIGVFVLTEMLFPPIRPEAPPLEEGAVESVEPPAAEVVTPPEPPGQTPVVEEPEQDQEAAERLVTVETPLYRMTFSSYGGVARSIQLLGYESFTREGPVELVPEGQQILGGIWVAGVGGDAFDLSRYAHTVTPAEGVRITEGDGPQTLTFRYDYPGGQFFSEIRYTFSPDSYIVVVEGDLPAIERASLFVDLGPGLEINELREADDRRMMAFAGNHIDDGITSRPLARVDEPESLDGPLRWAAVKSKYFVEVILPGRQSGGTDFLAGIRAEEGPVVGGPLRIRVGTPVSEAGGYAYRAYLGPIERERLIAIGDDLEEVNPYGWRVFRPIVRPFVGIVLWLVRFLHESLFLSYGWVLIVIGIGIRVVMWPLNRKMMLSQVKTMAVQPLAEEIKRKYGNDPQRMQQETLKLYKEHGVNPLAGCLPMMIPMPVLIALFFVFQNTIEMRGVPFMWLPDLSAPDPFYILPVFMGASLYLTQLLTMRISGSAGNPQMKMMLYMMPILLTVLFWRFPSGLNLYYATMNLASIPQQILIGRERKRMQAAGPLKRPV